MYSFAGSQIKNSFRLFSHRGFSLAELAVGMAITSIAVLGTATIIVNVKKSEQRSSIKYSFVTLRSQILDAIHSDKALEYTINADTDFQCVREQNFDSGEPYFGDVNGDGEVGCQNLLGPRPFMLKDGTDLPSGPPHGIVIADPTQADEGFTPKGQRCDTYSFSASPDPNCPFRVELRWEALCNGADPCIQPQIRISGWFVFSEDFARYNVANEDFSAIIENPVAPGREDQRYEAFMVSFTDNDGSGEQQCTPFTNNGWQDRAFNTINYDHGDNVEFDSGYSHTDVASAYQAFVIKNPGLYRCQVEAPAFDVGEHRIAFEAIDCTPGCPSEIASKWGSSENATNFNQTVSRLTTTFELTSQNISDGYNAFRVRHRCERHNTADINGDSNNNAIDWVYDFGIPSKSDTGSYTYTGITYITVECVRIRE